MEINLTQTAQESAKAKARKDSVGAPATCSTKLIPDVPLEEGSLDNENPHRRLARAIADLIRSEDGGISVGLEGSWGAGKTSVVRLLQKELGSRGELVAPGCPGQGTGEMEFTLINFDAWAHEGDPLRRSFLETLIPHLWEIGWVRKEQWGKRLDIISQRLEEKTTSNYPQVGMWGVAFGLALILAAVGSSLLSAAARDIRPILDTSLPIDRKFAAGLFLVFSPALVVLFAFITWLAKRGWRIFTTGKRDSKAVRRYARSTESGGGRLPVEDDSRSVWAMLFNKGITSERSRTFKTQNPTSIEFEREFRNLLEEALEGKLARDGGGNESGNGGLFLYKLWRKVLKLLYLHKIRRRVLKWFRARRGASANRPNWEQLKRRRVVLVLDNLDRVEASDALSVWSTLQTFLGRAGAHHDRWFKQLWVLVLYDPRGIRLLWDKSDEKSGQQNGSQAAAAGGGGDVKTSVVATADNAGSPTQSQPSDTDRTAVGVNAARIEGTSASVVGGKKTVEGAAAGSIAVEGNAVQSPEQIVHGFASTSFMDKSFQIRFEVPPPVLSDWRQSLFKFLGMAFPDNDHSDEFDDVQTILELHLAETNQEPTFRELKLFVNQIGSLHRQWAHCCAPDPEQGQNREKRFPLPDIAFYVLQRRRGVDVVGRLLEGTLIGGNYKGLLGENATATLAALAYNVGRAKAEQLILEKPIEDALLLGAEGADRLAALEKTHSEGFWEKLRIALNPNKQGQNAPARKSSLWVGNATQAILKSGILDPKEKKRHPLSESVVRQLCKCAGAPEITEWSTFDSKKVEALVALLRWKRELGVRYNDDSGKLSLEKQILRSASASIAPDEKKSVSESARDWLHNLSVLRREIEQNQPSGFDEKAQIETILEPIAEGFKPGADGIYWEIDSEKLSLLEEVLFLLSRNDRSISEKAAARGMVNLLVAEGHIFRHLEAKVAFDGINRATIPAIVRCLRMSIIEPRSLSLLFNTEKALTEHRHLHGIISAPDKDMVAAFVALLDERDELKLLLPLQNEDMPEVSNLFKKFVATCLEHILPEERRAAKLFDPHQVVKYWPSVYRLIGEARPLSPLLLNLVKSQPPDEMAQAISEQSSVSGLATAEEYCWLYVAALETSQLSSRLVLNAATWRDEIQKIEPEQWVKEIQTWGGRFELLFALREAGVMSDVPASYKEAVIESALLSLKGGEQFSQLPPKSPLILLDKSADREVFDQIYELAVKADGDIPGVFFYLYTDAIADPSRLSRDGFGKIFYPLLKRRNVPLLRWMRSVLEKNLFLLDTDAGWSFKQKVEDALSDYAGKNEKDKEKDIVYKELLKLSELIGGFKPKSTYSVWMMNAGPNKIKVNDILRINNIPAEVFAPLMRNINVPTLIREYVDKEAADQLAHALREAGADVEVWPLNTMSK
jgi:hypothetical protein